MALRIMLLTDVYPPLIGGVELQMQLLGRKLTQRGHSVCVVTAWQPGQVERDNDDGVQVYRIKGLASRLSRFSTQPGRRHHPPFPDPGVVWSLRRAIDRFRPDVIHAYGWITYSCSVALVGKSIPLLLSVREYAYTCALRTMMRYGEQPCDGPAPAKCLDCAVRFYGAPKGLAAALGVLSGRLLLRWKTSGIHSVSTYMQQNIRRDLYGDQKHNLPDVVIPSFHDHEDVAQDDLDIQDFLDRLPAQPFILFVGALRLVKGLRPLLAAYQRLVAPPPLVLLGRAAADTPSEFPANVTVLYDVPNRAVLAAWRRAMFGVAPSTWPEPFGNVVREAMSRGKAVIGTTPGGQTDLIVDGETGLLVPPNDVDALARAMQVLIGDPALRQRLGDAGRARARLFGADIVVPAFEQLYQRLVRFQRGGWGMGVRGW